MPTPFPKEFRRDVIAVARKGDQTRAQVAKSFGISDSCLARWLRIADREDALAAGGRRRRPARAAAIWRRRTESCASGLHGWSRRTRSCAGRRPTSPGTPSQNDVPAGPRPRR